MTINEPFASKCCHSLLFTYSFTDLLTQQRTNSLILNNEMQRTSIPLLSAISSIEWIFGFYEEIQIELRHNSSIISPMYFRVNTLRGWAQRLILLGCSKGVSSFTSPHYVERLRGLAVACWTTDHYHPCSNLGVGISEGCFVFHFTSFPLEVARPI